MDDTKVLNKALPQLIQEISLTVKFKAAIYAQNILSDDTLDDIFRGKENEDVIFGLVQKLKKQEGGLDALLSALKQAGQDNVATLVFSTRSSHLHKPTISGSSPGADNNASRASQQKLPSHQPLPADSPEPLKGVPKRLSLDKFSTKRTAKPGQQKEISSMKDVLPSNKPADYNMRQGGTREESDISSGAYSRPSSTRSRGGGGEVEELRARLEDSLPPNRYHTQMGDVAVMYDYVQACGKFQRGYTHTVPGPYANPPADKTALNGELVRGINPQTAAKMSQVLGGRPLLSYQMRHGGTAIVSHDGRLCYLALKTCHAAAPECSIHAWGNPSAPLADVIAALYGWYPAKLQTPVIRPGATQAGPFHEFTTLDPDMTVLTFYRDSKSCILHVTS